MLKEIKMLNAGQTTDIARIIKWLVSVGDTIKRGQVLLEVETDKAVLEVESFTNGLVVDILYKENDEVGEGDILLIVGNEEDFIQYQATGSKASEAKVEELEPEDDYVPIYPLENQNEVDVLPANFKQMQYDLRAMPNAKKIAKELDVKLEVIVPANQKIITRHDIVRAHSEAKQYNINQIIDQEKAIIVERQTLYEEKETMGELIPLSPMRKVITNRMLESTRNIPTFQLLIEVNMTETIRLRNALNRDNVLNKVSFNDILMKQIAYVTRKFEYVNARIEGDNVRLLHEVNIGLAVSIDNGLLVPVVRNVNALTIKEIAESNSKNIELARIGKLDKSRMGNASLTVSNLGGMGITSFNAIINPPESCILALGSIEEKPVWLNESWKPVNKMTIIGSFDHRIIDGAYGAAYMNELKKVIENPMLLLG